jgi:hypothetical protein
MGKAGVTGIFFLPTIALSYVELHSYAAFFHFQYGMYLRDIVDDLGKRKLRDITDFEWKRNMRFYGNMCEEGSKLITFPFGGNMSW